MLKSSFISFLLCSPLYYKYTLKQARETLRIIACFSSPFLRNYYSQLILENVMELVDQEILNEILSEYSSNKGLQSTFLYILWEGVS